jgi:hypothetical protein
MWFFIKLAQVVRKHLEAADQESVRMCSHECGKVGAAFPSTSRSQRPSGRRFVCGSEAL